ncbi:MAG: hypothetical protein ACR5LF_04630 [Symbiopectobacterium sp.]
MTNATNPWKATQTPVNAAKQAAISSNGDPWSSAAQSASASGDAATNSADAWGASA